MVLVLISGRKDGVLQTASLLPGTFIQPFIFLFVFPSILFFVSSRAYRPYSNSLCFCIVGNQLWWWWLQLFFACFCQFAQGRLELRSSDMCKFASKVPGERLLPCEHMERGEKLWEGVSKCSLTWHQSVKSWSFLCRVLRAWFQS